jgi:AcrR family transcriptional regulator
MALTHFAAGGVDAASLADIAADAGIALADVVAAFDSADALFLAAVNAALRPLTAELAAMAERDDPPAERLLRMTRRLATPTSDERTALFAILRELLDGNRRVARIYDACLSDSFQLLVRTIGEAQFCGDLKPLPPRFLLSVMLSGVVLPQLIGFGGAEGVLHGVHARAPGASDDDLTTPPHSALLAASLEAIFNGIATSTRSMDRSRS